MAYNTSKGKRDLGDIEFEGDPDTQIDFGNNSIKFKTDSKLRLSLTGSQIKTSHPLTCSIGFLLIDNILRKWWVRNTMMIIAHNIPTINGR